jgi:uncharacterized protein HemX
MTQADSNEHDMSSASDTRTGGSGRERTIILALLVALVALGGGMYVWRASAVRAVQDKLSQAETQQAQARSQLVDQAKQLNAQSSAESLRRFCTPLAWAIRREVIANNLDQVDQYFTELVRVPGMQSALLATPDAKITVASDRKQLTRDFSSLYPAQYLQGDAIRVEQAANGNLLAIVPIMGLNQHLATVVLEYTPAAYALH